jgi:2-oxo-4-hydroxy-4-carboxy--5-ureidoimidazoline (OHCU) decarboxylase
VSLRVRYREPEWLWDAEAELVVFFIRLAHLNKVYTAIYPSLPYITFVAGRPRSAIVTEIEERLGLEHARTPLALENGDIEQPALDSEAVTSKVRPRYSAAWTDELDRAVGDVWRIGQARLQGLVKP